MSERFTPSGTGFSDLVGRAVAGDRDALGELLRGYHDELRRYVAARLPARIRWTVDVEDVVQDTFHIAVRDMADLRARGRGSFLAWLRSIAASRIVDAIRAHTRKKRGGNRGDLHFPIVLRGGSVIDLTDVLETDENTPFHDACRAEVAERIDIAMARLPADHRAAVRLRFFEDRDIGEIAHALDRTYDAAAGLLKRSKQKLRGTLSPVSAPLNCQ